MEWFSEYMNSENFKRDKPGIIANLEEYVSKANAKMFVTNRCILEMLTPEELGFSRIGFSDDKIDGFIKLINDMAYSSDNSKQHEAIMYMMIASLYAVDYDLDEFKEMLYRKAMPFFYAFGVGIFEILFDDSQYSEVDRFVKNHCKITDSTGGYKSRQVHSCRTLARFKSNNRTS